MSSDRRHAPPLEIPDLEVPVAPRRQVARAPAVSPGAAARPDPVPFDAGSGAIEIEPFVENAPSGPRASAGSSVHDYFGSGMFDGEHGDDDLQLGNANLEIETNATRGFSAPAGPEWPTGRSPERAALSIDDATVRLGAGYPAAPSNPVLTPVYAWQVIVRRRALREGLARVDRELAAAEEQRDEVLARMVNERRPILEAEPRLAELLIPARQLGEVTGERGQALQAISTEYQGALATTDAQRAELQHRLAERQATGRERAAELARADESHRRAEARWKRLQIEIRSAIEVARQKAQAAGLPPGTAEPAEVAKIEELQQKAAAIGHEVAELQRARDVAANADLAAQNELNMVQHDLGQLANAQRSLDRQYGRQIDVRAAGLGEAERHLRFALAEAGRAVLAMRGGVAVDPTTLSAIGAADAEVARLTRENEVQLRALDACDQAAVQRGITIAAVLAGVLLLLFVALVVAAC